MDQFVLKNKNFLLLFIGSVVSNLGTQMFNFSMSLYILYITDGNAVAAGLFMAFGGLVFFALTPFAGALVDRFDKVKVVYITDFLNGVTILLAGLAIFSGLDNTTVLIILYVSSFILGVNSALFNPAARALPAYILEEEQLQQSQSLSQGMFALYSIIGVILGGIMYALIDIEWIFAINGVSFILSAFSEFFITTKTKSNFSTLLTFKSILIDIKEGFKYLLNFKAILSLVLIAALLNFFTTPVIANGLPYLFEIDLQVDSYYFAFLMASFPIGIIASSILLGVKKQSVSVRPQIVGGAFGMAITFAISTLVVYLHLNGYIDFRLFMILSVVAIIGVGFANSFINVPFGVALLKSVDKEMLGRVGSVVTLISNGLNPIAIGLGGLAIAAFGVMNLFFISLVAMFLTAILFAVNPHIKKI